MKKIEGCLHCNRCKAKCPYGLDTPAMETLCFCPPDISDGA